MGQEYCDRVCPVKDIAMDESTGGVPVDSEHDIDRGSRRHAPGRRQDTDTSARSTYRFVPPAPVESASLPQRIRDHRQRDDFDSMMG